MTIAAKAAMAARPIIIALPLLLLLLRPQPLNRVQDAMPCLSAGHVALV
jgi:hypothetical protein